MTDTFNSPIVFVKGSYDDLKTGQIRFLEEAAKLGNVHIQLYADDLIQNLSGNKPRFSENERRYFLESIRYVSQVTIIRNHLPEYEIILEKPLNESENEIKFWVVQESSANKKKEEFCLKNGLRYHVITHENMAGFPIHTIAPPSNKKSVMVSGCFDWVHSGHVRFFEEVSTLGNLTVVVGHDDNLRLLKGSGHPMFHQDERRYWVQAIRFVQRTLISSGHGWLDAEPEMIKFKPDIFAVNEDGDKPEKRNYCQNHNIEYKVLKRQPKPGLPVRISTELRGF